MGGDLLLVVAPERVVGVVHVVLRGEHVGADLPEVLGPGHAAAHVGGVVAPLRHQADLRVRRDRDAGVAHQVHHLVGMDFVIGGERAAMTRRDPALVALSDGPRGEIFERPAVRIIGVIHQHVDVLVVFLRQLEAEVDMGARVLVEMLVPGQSADHVGAHPHPLLHQLVGAGVADDRFLGKVDGFDFNDAGIFLAERDDPLQRPQPADGIDIGENAEHGRAVEDALLDRPAGALDDVFDGIGPLMLPGDLQAFLETVGEVRTHHVAEIALVEVHVPVDVGRRGQIAAGVDLALRASLDLAVDGGDPAVLDPDLPGAVAVEQARVADDQVHEVAPGRRFSSPLSCLPRRAPGRSPGPPR